MADGPDIARLAALIGDPARANMLAALMGGQALTASELALEAGVTKQTASSHLAQLTEPGLLTVTAQGRHRYYRLADADVAEMVEAMMGLAALKTPRSRPGPRDPAMRHARICYDHLAGELGVLMHDRMVARGWLNQELTLTASGREALLAFGLDLGRIEAARRPVCRPCLDWSVRRTHLAGGVGAALLTAILDRCWAVREEGSRIIKFSRTGEAAFREWLG